MTQDQTPSLRFPEFRGKAPWEVKPLNSVLDYGRPDNFFVSSTNYSTEGTPVLTANKSFILGYTKETDGIFQDTPVIIFDDFTTDKKYVDFPFKVKSSAIKILKQKGDDNLKLIFELMNKISLDAKEHKRYYISEYQNLSILLPKPDEQEKIAECLSSLDEVITIHGDRLDGLKDYKRGLMQQLFPAKGQTTPTLRFREFQGKAPWEKKRLNEVLNSISNGLNLEQVKEITSYKVTRIETISNDVINTEKVGYIKPEQDISSYKLNIGDMLYSNINSLSHIGRVVIIDRDYNLYHGMNLLRLVVDKNLNNPQFIYYLLNTEEMKLSFKSRANPAVNQASINQTELSKTRIIVPPPAEQQKIADCLSVMDDLITEQEQKIKTLKHHKNGLMQQLFPKL